MGLLKSSIYFTPLSSFIPAMAVGNQDHGGVAVAVAVLASCRDQPIDLGVGQVLARADLGVAAPLRWSRLVYCPINGARRATSVRCDFTMVFRAYCPLNEREKGRCRRGNRNFKGRRKTAAGGENPRNGVRGAAQRTL